MIAIEVASFGGPEGLRVVERPVPEPGPGEVLIRVEAVGVAWSDLLQREGLYPGGPTPPFVTGQEAAGVVVAGALPAGTRVSAIGRGLAAEYAVVPAAQCFAWDRDAEQRAALPISLLTAYHALVTCGHARAGEAALIHAAAGGLGHVAVQVARALGLVTIGTSSAAKRALVEADRACGYDELREPVDLALDSVGGAAFRATVNVVRPLGRILVVGASSGEPQRIDAIKLVHRSHAVIGVHLRALLERPELLASTIAAATAMPVRARVETMPLRDVARAHARLASRAVAGKLVLVT